MLKKILTTGIALVATVSLLVAVSCSSKKPVATGPLPATSGSEFTDQSGFGGLTTTTSTTTNATIESIDVAAKKMELRMPDGAVRSYEVDPDVVKLENAKAGDKVRVMTSEQRAVFQGRDGVAKDAGPVPADLDTPQGSSSLVRQSTTRNEVAKVTAIDAWNNAVTIRLTNGSTTTVKVRPSFNLANVSVGDTVSIRIAEATLITLEQP